MILSKFGCTQHSANKFASAFVCTNFPVVASNAPPRCPSLVERRTIVLRVVCGRTLRSASCHVERSRNIFALRAQGGHGMPCPYGGCLRYVFLYPAPFNPPYGGGLGRGFFSSISLSHQFLYRAAQLVGARCGLAVAANALEACNHVLILHTCYQLAYSLQVTVATAVELHFFQYSVLARYLNVSRTCSVCGVCYCFHGCCN